MDYLVFEGECRTIIGGAEACWRKNDPSYSWHVLDWLCYRQRLKYPLVRSCDQIIDMSGTVP
ncbi:hypothetical protein SAMN05444159_1237 [Bradyrhizobium lablabi]|uniref:Uncharacterized protein n=1 Tax=Bradyrhizobium lablabi TaxID=722472 RepID=A0A1M6LCJ6_9BRAD|nr:hypothetical protein SAMN05444159_1237 [Bradyrhizobium lablabi]